MSKQSIQHNQSLNTEFNNINNLLSQAIAEIRELSYELRPSVLRDFGFSEGVKDMISV